MKVVVFGATGAIGREVVDQLLDGGHDVIAYVRDPAKLDRTDPKLVVVTGELTDRRSVEAALDGADAVISALGPSLKRSTPAGPLAAGVRTIVDSMLAHDVRRFIGLATPSLADPQDGSHWKHLILPVMAKLAFPNALKELRDMTAAATDSPLDFTIARITNPTNKSRSGVIRSGFLGRDNVGSAMSRADIAGFLIQQLTDTRYRRAMPAISN